MNQRISVGQAACLTVLLLAGWSLTMAGGSRSEWLSVLLAAALSLPMLAVFCVPAERLPGMPLFDRLGLLFGRVGQRLFAAVLGLLGLWALCMATLSGVVFLRTVSGNAWPVSLIATAVLLSAGVLAYGGAARLAIWAEPVLWVVLAGLVFSILLSIPQWDWGQLLPLQPDRDEWLRQSGQVLSVPFAELFFAVQVLEQRSGNLRRGFVTGAVIAGLLLGLLAMRNVCVLGEAGAQFVQYPSYQTAGLLELGRSFARGEALISGALLLSLIARVAVLLCLCAQSAEQGLSVSYGGGIVLAAAIAGAVCLVGMGSTAAFRRAELLYQQLLLPAVLVLGVVFAAAALWHSQRTRQNK